MSDRKRSATNDDTPRPKKSRSADLGRSSSSNESLPRALRKLPSKPNHLLSFARATSKASSSDLTSAGKKTKRWTESEDTLLTKIVTQTLAGNAEFEGSGMWSQISGALGTGRSAKQCRERWINYLRPGIKKGDWTAEEEELILEMYSTFGPRWSAMAKLLKNRTDNDIKNKWNAMNRSQERKQARWSPQVSSLSTETESLESLQSYWPNISPMKLAAEQRSEDILTTPRIFKQEDEDNATEI